MTEGNLFQIHHQFDDHTEMVEQNVISTNEEMMAWAREVAESHPLPEGARWLYCNEKSEYFVMAVA